MREAQKKIYLYRPCNHRMRSVFLFHALPWNLGRGHEARSAKKNFLIFTVPATIKCAVFCCFALYLGTLGTTLGAKREKNFFRFTVTGTLEGAGTAPRKEKRKKKKEKREKKKRFATQP